MVIKYGKKLLVHMYNKLVKKIDAMRKSTNTVASEVADRFERVYQEHLEHQKKQRAWFKIMGIRPKLSSLA
ncbi:alpha-glucuronidase [Bacillus sp. RC242]|uniref:hypothetical protein n=1 Tax=Bacillus sp. RC242 TaxID=3156286 RepID=UPI0038364BCB